MDTLSHRVLGRLGTVDGYNIYWVLAEIARFTDCRLEPATLIPSDPLQAAKDDPAPYFLPFGAGPSKPYLRPVDETWGGVLRQLAQVSGASYEFRAGRVHGNLVTVLHWTSHQSKPEPLPDCGHGLDWALRMLECGRSVRRSHWGDQGQFTRRFVKATPPDAEGRPWRLEMIFPEGHHRYPQGLIIPWHPYPCDIFAKDWEEA